MNGPPRERARHGGQAIRCVVVADLDIDPRRAADGADLGWVTPDAFR